MTELNQALLEKAKKIIESRVRWLEHHARCLEEEATQIETLARTSGYVDRRLDAADVRYEALIWSAADKALDLVLKSTTLKEYVFEESDDEDMKGWYQLHREKFATDAEAIAFAKGCEADHVWIDSKNLGNPVTIWLREP